MGRLTASALDDIKTFKERMRGTWKWKTKRFILPRKCHQTNTWTGWFPLMYKGTRTHLLSRSEYSPREEVLISKETMMIFRLEGRKLFCE